MKNKHIERLESMLKLNNGTLENQIEAIKVISFIKLTENILELTKQYLKK